MSTQTARTRTNFYGRLWQTAPKELLYLLLGFPFVMTGFALTFSFALTGALTIIVFLGIFLLMAALYVGRGFGLVHVNLLEWVGRPTLERPDWKDALAGTGFRGWLSTVLGNGHYWLYLFHTMVLGLTLTTITWSITFSWLVVGVAGTFIWINPGTVIVGSHQWSLASRFFEFFRVDTSSWNLELADNIVACVMGLLALATLPFVTRAMVMLQWWLARAMLTISGSEGLRREVKSLEASRGAALSAEGHSLRRLERDIHDGPQQRLVRLQMDIAAASRQLSSDPEKARGLLVEAQAQSAEALEELRALSRGFAPPLLLDRGLTAALESVVARAAVPTTLHSEFSVQRVLPAEIERASYFVVSELLTNVAKHAGASQARVQLSTQHVDDGAWLLVGVLDDGHGGATITAEHGLAGIEERVRGVGGWIEIISPDGGPTSVTAHIPLPKQSPQRATVEF